MAMRIKGASGQESVELTILLREAIIILLIILTLLNKELSKAGRHDLTKL